MNAKELLQKRRELQNQLANVGFELERAGFDFLDSLPKDELRILAAYGLHRYLKTGVDARCLASPMFWKSISDRL